ncbi:hypothetical protein GCM10010145_22360 [Streptomyces ruber]|uniref:Uncharacterized protein n=2 Tax=Streptomyces TaxID=1883 RepID=A0A918BAU1_9ACTN|nr:hypothetical protein GCM10010145_22360 [Streptomyces ruber]
MRAPWHRAAPIRADATATRVHLHTNGGTAARFPHGRPGINLPSSPPSPTRHRFTPHERTLRTTNESDTA